MIAWEQGATRCVYFLDHHFIVYLSPCARYCGHQQYVAVPRPDLVFLHNAVQIATLHLQHWGTDNIHVYPSPIIDLSHSSWRHPIVLCSTHLLSIDNCIIARVAVSMQTKSDTSIPIGMLAAVGFVTAIYMLMAAALVMLVPVEALIAQEDTEFAALSSFAFGFAYHGMHWATYIVSLGACVGILTSTGIGTYGFARVITALSRERMIPPALGFVWERTGTPVFATALAGVIVGR